jgi:sulfopyruvate decarboxylase subunit alpha
MPSRAAVDRMSAALAENGLEWLLTVPTTGLQSLYKTYEDKGRCLFATREEEAIGLASGLVLAGARPVVIMQQTGVGNAINAVLSLADAYEIRFPVIVCDRTASDPNVVQRVSSIGTLKALNALGCVHLDWESPESPEELHRHIQAGERWIICPAAGLE